MPDPWHTEQQRVFPLPEGDNHTHGKRRLSCRSVPGHRPFHWPKEENRRFVNRSLLFSIWLGKKGGLTQAVGTHTIFFHLDCLKDWIKGTPAAAVSLVSLALKTLATVAAYFRDGFTWWCHKGDCTLLRIQVSKDHR